MSLLENIKPVITIEVPAQPVPDARRKITQILGGARERVRQGWIQGMGTSPDGRRVCAANAIGMAASRLGMDSISYAAQTILLKAAEESTTVMWDSIPQWNDNPGRTQQEVMDTFDLAIKLLERDGS